MSCFEKSGFLTWAPTLACHNIILFRCLCQIIFGTGGGTGWVNSTSGGLGNYDQKK